MKYIRERNGRREIIEKRRHSQAYFVQALIKWFFCIGILVLTLLLCQFLDKKLNNGKLMEKLRKTVSEQPGNKELQSTEIAPTETETEEKRLRVCIDPGHGGLDPGCDYNGRIESADNWNFALAVKAEMEQAGIDVVMTREDNDSKVFLKDRVDMANASGADYFVSIHRNKGDGYGIETWMTGNAGNLTKSLANNVHSALVEAGVQRDRGVKLGTETGEGSDYYVIGNTKMPACLIELGFINNEEDNRLYEEKMEAYAKAITKAVSDTYQQHREGNNLLEDQSESTEESSQDPSNGPDMNGMVLNNPVIDNVSTLSTEKLNWGQGNNVDESNRPTGSLSYQEKFKDYPVDFIVPANEKVIYLTIDEGYENGFTAPMLDTLKEKDVTAVFFVTKYYADSSPDLVQRMISDGHILGNHSVSHPSTGISSLSVEEQKEEVMGLHRLIKEQYSYDMCLFRYPAGIFSEQSLAVLNNCGYRSIFWSFAYLDYDVNSQPDEEASLQKMINKLHPGAIYLLHAESQTNSNVLGSFIDQAREAGYRFGVYTDTLK